MLEFYAVYDDEETPEDPDEQRFLGGLDLDDYIRIDSVFRTLQSEGLCDFPYFEDARCGSESVERACALLAALPSEKRTRLASSAPARRTLAVLEGILQAARDDAAGIATYCD